ncbi:MAG: UDP-N-acetylmuramoyl-tripeptide--D-alanyl-D-alanine ligase [Clostridia bacterium]|nr:UDP-N-acetylmuramoyl-tripeptide--D-alanyl-D-alanine ligase [Clostridia bacterium]
MKITFSEESIWNAGRLALMCGGRLQDTSLESLPVRGLCTDSREADADTAFVAMRGERVDGHDYIASALQNGCRCILCEQSCEAIEKSRAAAVVVGDSELSLSRLANAYRKTLSMQTVAVTGSVGKTTTKEMIYSVLNEALRVHKSDGNYNSVIGMPLSLMEADSRTEVAVLEMGMSAFGEIERMSITAEPEIAVITNIGSSHMEMLGSRENICRAKLEILCGLADGGTLILNGDEPLLAGIGGKSYHTQYVSLVRQNADFFAQNIRVYPEKTVFDAVYGGHTERDLTIRVMGRHNVYAALYAFAVGIRLGVSPDRIRAGLLKFEPTGMRQNRYAVGEITVIEDCYNASPESMIAAIDVLKLCGERAGGRCIAVLGDMLELGEGSSAAHRSVGMHLARCGIDKLLVLGHEAQQIATGAMQCGMRQTDIVRESELDSAERLGSALAALVRAGDTVLFKASRSVRMERVLNYLKEHPIGS